MRVTGLVYLRGGGLLCATCALAPDAHATLASVAAPNWRPHITWRGRFGGDFQRFSSFFEDFPGEIK